MSAGLHCSAQQLCDAAGISRRMYFNCLNVHRLGCAELLDCVHDGTVTINLALEVARFNHSSQRMILAEFHDVPIRKRLGFVRRIYAAWLRDPEQANV